MIRISMVAEVVTTRSLFGPFPRRSFQKIATSWEPHGLIARPDEPRNKGFTKDCCQPETGRTKNPGPAAAAMTGHNAILYRAVDVRFDRANPVPNNKNHSLIKSQRNMRVHEFGSGLWVGID